MKKCYSIGITGGSGSGKTYFINKLAQKFSSNEVCVLSQDHYYKPRDLQFTDTEGVKNFDLPAAIERERFYEDFLKLKNGEVVRTKEYTFNNPAVIPKVLEFRPAPILIIEGLFVLYFEEIARELDLKIFIEAKDHIKLSRRIKRDNDERGYDVQDVLYRFQNHVMPVYENVIRPLKHETDFIIPNNSSFDKALDVIAAALRSKLQADTKSLDNR